MPHQSRAKKALGSRRGVEGRIVSNINAEPQQKDVTASKSQTRRRMTIDIFLLADRIFGADGVYHCHDATKHTMVRGGLGSCVGFGPTAANRNWFRHLILLPGPCLRGSNVRVRPQREG
jgi:hypothetical protein